MAEESFDTDDEYAALGKDLISEIDNLSSVSSRSAISNNRKMITSKFKIFQTIVLGKAKKVKNAKKLSDILLYVDDLEESVGVAVADIVNGSFITPTISKKIGVEYLRTNKYECENDKVDPDILKMILSMMSHLGLRMVNHANNMDTVSKLDQLLLNIDNEIFKFFEFLQI